MSDNANPGGWPDADKPGVPLNPERDGWHWLSVDPGGDPCAFNWWASKGVWLADDNHPEPADERAPKDMADVWECYLGPCLTPQEVAAREAAARAEGMRKAAGIVEATAAIFGTGNITRSPGTAAAFRALANAILAAIPEPKS